MTNTAAVFSVYACNINFINNNNLGLRSLSHHSSAAFIGSFCSSGFATTDNHHLMNAVNLFISLVSSSDAISPELAIESPPSQRSQ